MVSEKDIENIVNEIKGLKPEEQQKKFTELIKNFSKEEQKEIIEKLSGGNECLFCQIADGKVETKKVYEDKDVMAVLDINPANKGHILVLPKKHYNILNEVDEEIIKKLFVVANKLSGIVYEIVKAEGTNIVVSNGKIAGQRVAHVLVNVIPRFKDDKVYIGWDGAKAEDMDELQKKIEKKVKEAFKKEEPKKKEIKFNELEPRIP